jgi:hypothetical protein
MGCLSCRARRHSTIDCNPMNAPRSSGPRTSAFAISRRRFLCSVAAIPLSTLVPASVFPARSGEIVMHDGWILRRDDLPRLLAA